MAQWWVFGIGDNFACLLCRIYVRKNYALCTTIECARDVLSQMTGYANKWCHTVCDCSNTDRRGRLETNRAVLHIDIQAVKACCANQWPDVDRASLTQSHAERYFAGSESFFKIVFHVFAYLLF